MSELQNNYVYTKLYDTSIENATPYSTNEFLDQVYKTVLNEDSTESELCLPDVILIYLAYFKYATYESLHVFNRIGKKPAYLKRRCLQIMLKQGLISMVPINQQLGKSEKVICITKKGVAQLAEKGFNHAVQSVNDFMNGTAGYKQTTVRSHEYALSLFLSSLLHSGAYTFIEYEDSIRMSNRYKDFKKILRPDAVIRLLTPAPLLPDFLGNADLPKETFRLNSNTQTDNTSEYFSRTYYIEQDMGTEKLQILDDKISSYYTHNLFQLDLYNPYSGIVFTFAKPYTPAHEYLSFSTMTKLTEYIIEANKQCVAEGKEPFTLKSYLSMSPVQAKEAKAFIGEWHFEKTKKAAGQLLNIREELLMYDSTSNYDATCLYHKKPILCNNRRIDYREAFVYMKGGRKKDTSATRIRELGITKKLEAGNVGDFDSRFLNSSNSSVSKGLRVDAPSADYKRKKPDLSKIDMTGEELEAYTKSIPDLQCREFLYDFNKVEYNFAKTRKNNLCSYYEERMIYFASGCGSSDKLRTIRHMLSGLSVYAATSVLGFNSLYALLPEYSGLQQAIRDSLKAYVSIENGLFHCNYSLQAVPLEGYPETFDMETENSFICLEDIEELVHVQPAYVFSFSFLEMDITRNISDTPGSSTNKIERASSAYEILSMIYDGEEQQKKADAYEFFADNYGEDDEEEETDQYPEERFINHCSYLAPAQNRNPIPENVKSLYASGKDMYHICIENISADISGYVRLYYMCSFVRRDTDMLLVGIVDTYSDAAAFASQFPDLYKAVDQDIFDFNGLQLMFLLKSDLGCRRNALFRVGHDGSIYRVKDNVIHNLKPTQD